MLFLKKEEEGFIRIKEGKIILQACRCCFISLPIRKKWNPLTQQIIDDYHLSLAEREWKFILKGEEYKERPRFHWQTIKTPCLSSLDYAIVSFFYVYEICPSPIFYGYSITEKKVKLGVGGIIHKKNFTYRIVVDWTFVITWLLEPISSWHDGFKISKSADWIVNIRLVCVLRNSAHSHRILSPVLLFDWIRKI